MTPASGIEVIDVNSEDEVEAFCKGVTLAPSRDVFKHTGIFRDEATEAEQAYSRKLQQLDEEVRKLAQAVRS